MQPIAIQPATRSEVDTALDKVGVIKGTLTAANWKCRDFLAAVMVFSSQRCSDSVTQRLLNAWKVAP